MRSEFVRRIYQQILQVLLRVLTGFKRLMQHRVLRHQPCLFGYARRAYQHLVAALLRRSGCFDADYYLESNPDVARSGCDPVLHYVTHGEAEGRQPAPLFDPSHYRQQLDAGAIGVNALLHYAWVGRRRGLSPSPWFDQRFYLSRYPDVASAGVDPVEHYVRYGGIEGRSPSQRFDGAFYLRNNPDVAAARVNPLLHYLRHGRAEGRLACPAGDAMVDDVSHEQAELMVAEPPSEAEWVGLEGRAYQSGVKVDVVVPVFKGYAETLRCLLSVLKAPVTIPYCVTVVDDASPEPRLVAALERLRDLGLISLIQNPENLGFVGSVNRGMALHRECDVVLLNSDTEVYGDWLDRLYRTKESQARTGTVTPLSNNATICSYPRFAYDNPYPLEIDYPSLDTLASRLNAGVVVDCPSGVGFCMYIVRAALDDVGLFDEQTFGRGYGEENDFCQRAMAKGWRNLISAEVFVRHLGAMSFQGDKAQRVAEATQTIGRLYPAYHQDVANFIAADPLYQARQRLDWARMLRQRAEENLLLVCHGRGGGTERNLREVAQRAEAAGKGVFVLRPTRYDPARVHIIHARVRNVPNLAGFHIADLDGLSTACRDLGITDIQVHSCIDFAPEAPATFRALADASRARLTFHIHDYELICPRINLADEQGVYCGEPDITGCNRCLASRGSESGARDIEAWRHRFGLALSGTCQIVVPDTDVAERLKRYYPDVALEVCPHEESVVPANEPLRIAASHDTTHTILVIGAISAIKGFHILRQCAEAARKHRLPLKFVLMGYSYDDATLERAGVTVTGRYDDDDALSTLNGLRPALIWLPSTAPETYSYTLSLAIKSGYPVVAFDLGAVASRLRKAQYPSTLLPLDMLKKPEAVNQQLLQIVQRQSGGEHTQPPVTAA